MTHPERLRRSLRGAGSRQFDPRRYRRELVAILRELTPWIDAAQRGQPPSPRALHAVLRRHPRDGTGLFSRSQLLAGFRALQSEERFGCDERSFVELLRMKPTRTQSGVAPVTVFTRPHPCPGKCVFCPNDVRMPKSYLSDEPGCQRAEDNSFDPYLQCSSRLLALHAIGHTTDKVELIVLGGTWSFYPETYQVWFVTRCFDALNDFDPNDLDHIRRQLAQASRMQVVPAKGSDSYNARVTRSLTRRLGKELVGADERASWDELQRAHARNEHAATRCVGLVVETRPDYVCAEEVLRIRRLGGTKVQLGYQSLDDEVLRLNKRGHDVAAARRATDLLRDAGFKIHGHWMPNLLGADPEADRRDFQRLFEDPALRPDELKIYPCSLIDDTELMDFHAEGAWRPYERDELIEILVHALEQTPRYCRLTRVIRDIPSQDIVAGNRLSNLREMAERELARRGGRCRDIRSREVRHGSVRSSELLLRTSRYASSVGEERFIELVTREDQLAGFVRLSLPTRVRSLEEVAHSAIIRELHVYGAALGLGVKDAHKTQHRGLGKRLVQAATESARQAGLPDLAVISAVGTRPYYRRLGFSDGALYQHRLTARA